MKFICPGCGRTGELIWGTEEPPKVQTRTVFSTFGPKDAYNLSGGRAVVDGMNACSVAELFIPSESGKLSRIEFAVYRSPLSQDLAVLRAVQLYNATVDLRIGELLTVLPAIKPRVRTPNAAATIEILDIPADMSLNLVAGKPYWLALAHNPTGATRDVWNFSSSTIGRSALTATNGGWSYLSNNQSCAFRVGVV